MAEKILVGRICGPDREIQEADITSLEFRAGRQYDISADSSYVEVEYSGEALVLIKIPPYGGHPHTGVTDVKDRWPFTFVLKFSGRMENDRLAAWEIDEVDISPGGGPPQRARTQQPL